MNYEEKYKEALGWMRSIYPTMQGVDKEDAEHYFPELKESEDERIRKELNRAIAVALDYSYFDKETADNCIAWLEKQGEQKPAWSEEDESMFLMCSDAIAAACAAAYYTTEEMNKMQNWLKSLKPNHWKPSEQNIKDLEWCADLVKDKMGVGFHRLQVFIDEIKKL